MMNLQFGARITDAKKQAEARAVIRTTFPENSVGLSKSSLYQSSSMQEVLTDLRDAAQVRKNMPAGVYKAYLMVSNLSKTDVNDFKPFANGQQIVASSPEVESLQLVRQVEGASDTFVWEVVEDTTKIKEVLADAPKTEFGAVKPDSVQGMRLGMHLDELFGVDRDKGQARVQVHYIESLESAFEHAQGFDAFLSREPSGSATVYYVVAGIENMAAFRPIATRWKQLPETSLRGEVREKENVLALRFNISPEDCG